MSSGRSPSISVRSGNRRFGPLRRRVVHRNGHGGIATRLNHLVDIALDVVGVRVRFDRHHPRRQPRYEQTTQVVRSLLQRSLAPSDHGDNTPQIIDDRGNKSYRGRWPAAPLGADQEGNGVVPPPITTGYGMWSRPRARGGGPASVTAPSQRWVARSVVRSARSVGPVCGNAGVRSEHRPCSSRHFWLMLRCSSLCKVGCCCSSATTPLEALAAVLSPESPRTLGVFPFVDGHNQVPAHAFELRSWCRRVAHCSALWKAVAAPAAVAVGFGFFHPGLCRYVVVSWVMAGIKLYALCTIGKQGWLTRQVGVADGVVVRTGGPGHNTLTVHSVEPRVLAGASQ